MFDGGQSSMATMGAVMKDALNVLHGDVATFDAALPMELSSAPPEPGKDDPMGPAFLAAAAQNKPDVVVQIGSARPFALCALEPGTGRNALGVAILHGAVDVVRVLFETFQFAARDPEIGFDTVMHAAAASKSLPMLQYLASYPPARVYLDAKCMFSGQTPLSIACHEGSFEYALALIQSFRCDVNTTDNTGGTLLHVAAQSGNAMLVEYLIRSCSLSTHDVDRDGRIPLFYACRAGDAGVVKVILTWGKPNTAPMALVECVGIAAQRNFPVLAGLLISDLGVEVDCRLTSTCKGVATDRHSNTGYTPFMLACMSGASSSVSFLHKQYHADPSLTNSVTGENTLHLAVSHGHWEIVVYLLEECEQDPRYRFVMPTAGFPFVCIVMLMLACCDGGQAVERDYVVDGSHGTRQHESGSLTAHGVSGYQARPRFHLVVQRLSGERPASRCVPRTRPDFGALHCHVWR
jgi:ankyrin repeat protein